MSIVLPQNLPTELKNLLGDSFANSVTAEFTTWLEARAEALDYLDNDTEFYTKKYFDDTTMEEVPVHVEGIVSRLIERVSQVYMIPPKRSIGEEETPDQYQDLVVKKGGRNSELQYAEQAANLLREVVLHPAWYRNPDRVGLETLVYYLLIYAPDDPINPIAIMYPLNGFRNDGDPKDSIWCYWSASQKILFDGNGGSIKQKDNPGNKNPWGDVWPFVVVRTTKSLHRDRFIFPKKDLVSTTLEINVLETNANVNGHYQSFGWPWASGHTDDPNKPTKMGPNILTFFPDPESRMDIAQPPDTMEGITSYIEFKKKSLAANNHVPFSTLTGEDAPASGVALRIRNLELTDSRRSDVSRFRLAEHQLWIIDGAIINTVVSAKPMKDDGFAVDFSESTEVLSPEEQRAKDDWDLAHNVTTVPKIMVRRDPDGFSGKSGNSDPIVKATEQVEQNKKTNAELRTGANLGDVFASSTLGTQE